MVSWIKEGICAASGRNIVSRKREIWTVGHEHPDTIGRPGFPILWILGSKHCWGQDGLEDKSRSLISSSVGSTFTADWISFRCSGVGSFVIFS